MDSRCNHMAKGELDDEGFGVCSNCKERYSTSDTEELVSSMKAHLSEVFERWKNDLKQDEAEHLERIKRELEK